MSAPEASGKWVLVSGGTGGIGVALIKHLANAGFRPAIGYRVRRAEAEKLAELYGGEPFALDLDNSQQIDAATTRLSKRKVVALVLNASPEPDLEMFRKVTAESFEKQFRISVIGNHRLLASMVGNVFRRNKEGVVVGVLTRAMGSDTESALKYVTAYVVAKYGLLGLLRCARTEYPWLRVETISPDFTDTPILGAFDDRFVSMLRQRGQLMDPSAVAEAILRKITG